MADQSKDMLTRAALALRKANARISELETRLNEPIAIVGMACRFPGAATPEEFWTVLQNGEDRIREFPDHRLVGAWPEGAPRWAGLLDAVDSFDAEFFGISPREAVSLDPQQRLTLEVSWEALERAAIVPGTLFGTKTGVFVGLCSIDYYQRVVKKPYAEREAYDLTGNIANTASGRVAYSLGLQGPAMTLDTACSSSLSAIHLACASLRNRETDLALAGAAHVISTEDTTAGLHYTHALSPDGRCKTFDVSANGFARGEGCGILVLERLSDAQKHGRRILAIVRGTAVNQDGKSTGLTAPNVLSQEALLRDALASASLTPDQVSYVECHGTGTSLGDPIEVEAIKAVFAPNRASQSKLWLGAVKTNIGHLEAAAGLAGVIKVVLAMQHRQLPRNLHLRHLNPRLGIKGTPLAPLTAHTDWTPESGSRIAGVSAFGLSGTNAHVVLQEAPVSEPEQAAARPRAGVVPLIVSGRDVQALREQAARLADALAREPSVSLVDVGHSLLTTRTQFSERAVVVAGSVEQARARLLELSTDTRTATSNPRVAVLFTGQGAQRSGMGRELHDSNPEFRRYFDEICACFDQHLEVPLRTVVFASEGSEHARLLDQTAYTQPALFAVEVALFRMYAAWGLVPDVLLGHSIGELAAAHVAGVLSLADACKLVAARGRLMQALPSGGAMLSIQASEAELLPLLDGVDIAGLNGPLSTVVSGEEPAIAAIERHFEQLGRRTRRLTVSHAFHSRCMDPMLAEFREVAASLSFAAPKLPIVSNVTGKLASADELTSPDYWVRHVREAVRFLDGVQTLEARGVDVCLELGPHGVLCSMASACLSESGQHKLSSRPGDRAEIALLAALRREQAELETVTQALGNLHCCGVAVDWSSYFEPFTPRRVELPTYAFQRQRYWLDITERAATDVASAGLANVEHALIGAAVPLADSDALVFTARLSLADHAWLADHIVFGHHLVPGTGLLDLAVSAGAYVGAAQLDELSIEVPLTLKADEAVAVQVSVATPDEAGRRRVAIYSRPVSANADAPWTLHASGSLSSAPTQPNFELSHWPPVAARELELAGLYERLAQSGLRYGPSFQGLVRAWTEGDIRYAEVRLPDGLEADGFAIHPALLDAALHVLVLTSDSESISLPFAWSGVSWFAAGATSLRVRLTPAHSSGSFTLEVGDAAGRPLAVIQSLATRAASAADIRDALVGARAQQLYRVDWKPLAKPVPRRFESVVQLGGDPLAGVVSVDSLTAIERPPELLLVPCCGPATSPLAATNKLLALLQNFLADNRLLDTRLAIVTRRAISTRLDEDVLELDHAPAWGLVRAAQSEHPDRRVILLDVERFDANILDALAADEPQLALRNGDLHVPRLAPARSPDVLIPPRGNPHWHLDTVPRGTLENLAFVQAPQLAAPLPPGHVRVRVEATGLNFRDVLNALGMYPGDPGPLGYEGAGVVTEVADDVSTLKVGDRVFGMLRAGFAAQAVVDQRLLTAMPSGWSFIQAASVPVVFLTAYYAFVDLARLAPGERVLIHAATGGVGMAATQLARHLGAEVFGTGSPSKWPVLRELGFDDAHIANSRTLEFETDFLKATHGQGVDVVLDALAREFVDASLRLLPRGGRFLEMGKTDVRDPEQVAAQQPGVVYKAFDLIDAGLDRIQTMLRELVALFEAGVLQPLPTKTYDLRRVPEAFRFIGQAKHVGKLVVTATPSLDANGTVLITGGTGALGAHVAKHLVRHHRVRHLLLSSRRGGESPGATELQRELQELGAKVRIVAADVAVFAQAQALLDAIPREHPLTAVIHTAGVIEDGLLSTLTPQQVAIAFAPKVDAVLNLHRLTQRLPLAAFVVFSSIAGALGSAAQANYAAANTFLDAMCAHRQALGLPAVSLAWGPWADGGMAARLAEADLVRMKRSGLPPITAAEGLELLDAALARPEPALVPVRIDLKAMASRTDPLPRILSGLVRVTQRAATTAELGPTRDLSAQIAAAPTSKRLRLVSELVQAEAAVVLGISNPSGVSSKQALQELGLDSLMAVELRNRLQNSSGLRLPATFLFDYPTVTSIAEFMLDALAPTLGEPPSDAALDERELRDKLASIPIASLREAGLLDRLLQLVDAQPAAPRREAVEQTSVDEMSLDDLINFVLPDSN